MATGVFHLFPLVGGLLCAEHVRGRRGGELSPVSRGTRERGEGTKSSQEGQKA